MVETNKLGVLVSKRSLFWKSVRLESQCEGVMEKKNRNHRVSLWRRVENHQLQ